MDSTGSGSVTVDEFVSFYLRLTSKQSDMAFERGTDKMWDSARTVKKKAAPMHARV